MSDNVYNGKTLHVNAYVNAHGIDFTDAPMFYNIMNNDGARIDLVGWEAILLPLAILRDALHHESLREGIRSPSREQLDELSTAIDKVKYLLPPE